MTVTKPDVKPNLGHYDITPENAVGSYVESTNLNSLFGVYEKQACLGDITGLSLELSHIEIETKFHEAQQLLVSLIEKVPENKENSSYKVRRSIEILKELRDDFEKTNNFIKLNDQKCKIAERGIQGELRAQEKLSKEIEKVQEEIAVFEGFFGKLQSEVDKLEPYESVINDVVKDSDLFVSVQDCMDRCDGLSRTWVCELEPSFLIAVVSTVRAQDEIRDLQKEILAEAKEVQAEYTKAVNEVSATDLGLRNEMTDVEELYLTALADIHTWEDILGKIKQVFINVEINTAKVEEALKSICITLSQRQKETAINFDNFLPVDMLEYIANEVTILDQILKRCQTTRKSKRLSSVSSGGSTFRRTDNRKTGSFVNNPPKAFQAK